MNNVLVKKMNDDVFVRLTDFNRQFVSLLILNPCS